MDFKFVPRNIRGDIGAYRKGNVLYINLLQAFVLPASAQAAMDLIATATKDDEIELTLSTPGGNALVLSQLGALLDATEATVKMFVARTSSSCGGFVLAHADELFVLPTATIMFHNASLSMQGSNVNVMRTYAESSDVVVENYTRRLLAKGALTEGEVADITQHNKDIVLLGEDLIERGFAKELKLGEAV